MDKSKALALRDKQEKTVNAVLNKVNEFKDVGTIHLPKDYSPENALKGAWFKLMETKDRSGKLVLDSCTNESIVNALFKMTTQGLNPMKKQCSFIAYGDKLEMQPEYNGNIALAKRYGDLKEIHAHVVYEGDVFKYGVDSETGRMVIFEHKPDIENIDLAKIKGAYAVKVMNDNSTDVEVMSMAQIQKSWEQGAMKGKSPAHINFKDQMCLKTVINRATKILINSSDDSAVIPDTLNEAKPSVILSDEHSKTLNIQEAIEVKEEKKEEPVTKKGKKSDKKEEKKEGFDAQKEAEKIKKENEVKPTGFIDFNEQTKVD